MDKEIDQENERLFGRFFELGIKENVNIGEMFYQCNLTKLHQDGKLDEQSCYWFYYLGTDSKVINIEVVFKRFNDDKLVINREQILTLPLNEKKQALFLPKHLSEMKKNFLMTLVDSFGNLEIQVTEAGKTMGGY